MSEVTLKLIETVSSKPEQVSNKGNKALIIACKNKMPEIVLKLIKTR